MRLPTAGVRPLPSEEDLTHTMQAQEARCPRDDACRPDPRRGTAPLECRGPPRRPRPRRDCRRRPVRAAFGARRPRHQRPVRLQGARRPGPDRHRADRQPGHQPVRRQLRQERPLHPQRRHQRRQRPGHRLCREVQRPGRQGNQPYHIRKYTGAAAVSLNGPGKPVADGRTNGKAKHATGPRASRPGPASARIRSSST